jgi:hypothetical protein
MRSRRLAIRSRTASPMTLSASIPSPVRVFHLFQVAELILGFTEVNFDKFIKICVTVKQLTDAFMQYDTDRVI